MKSDASETHAKHEGLSSLRRWNMPKPLLAITEEHKYVYRLLALLNSEVDNITSNNQVDYDCMRDILHYMTNFPDRYHHPKENLIFDRVASVSTATEKAIARLRREHQKMPVQAKDLQAKVCQQIHLPDSDRAKEIAEMTRLYVRTLRSHMHLEESAVFEPALEHLTEHDWLELEREIRPVVDPLFGETVSKRYLALMQRYLNHADSVTESGVFPAVLAGAAAGKVEKTFYRFAKFRHIPRRLTFSFKQSMETRVDHIYKLRKIRNFSSLYDWYCEGWTLNREDWLRVLSEAREAIDFNGQSEADNPEDVRPQIIPLSTENDILEYQAQSYVPDKRSTISWQAGLVNFMSRMTIKPVLGLIDLEKLNNNNSRRKNSVRPPPRTRIETIEQDNFHGIWMIPERTQIRERTILYLPGGGFFAPATVLHRQMVAKIASRTQSKALLANYRLLPNHPFPAGLEDALSAYRYLLASGISPDEIVLAGDSSGGNLCLATMLAARDEGMALPAGCVLMSPATDMTYTTPSRKVNRWVDPLLPSRVKMDLQRMYAGDHPLDYPLISPVFGNFHDLPPMYAFVSSSEVLLDDTLMVARKARAQGVDFKVEVWEGLPHAWPIFPFLPEAETAIGRMVKFLLSRFEV